MEDGGGGEVAGQQAARVGQHRLGVHQGQHEEGDGPHTVEDLKNETHQKLSMTQHFSVLQFPVIDDVCMILI